MSFVVWHAQDAAGNPIPGATVRGESAEFGNWTAQPTNPCGDTFTTLAPGTYNVTFSAPGFKDDGYYPATIGDSGMITKGLERSVSPIQPWMAPRGAFCIPDALPGSSYGDGKRVWDPAFGCFDSGTQDRMIQAHLSRGHNTMVYQVSGLPYHNDYPELDADPARVVRDLSKIRAAGLQTIICLDDRRLDLSYLAAVAAATQGLVNCVMGIFEVNGVVDWNEDEVIRILTAQHNLWPGAMNAFHSTSQDNGGRGFGERPFWERAVHEAVVECYFLQQSAWLHTPEDTANRASDFCSRLQGPHAGWFSLPYGMVLFEETTSVTYRTAPESYGIEMMDTLMNLVQPRPMGFMDGGSSALL